MLSPLSASSVTAAKLGFFAALMFGFGYAMVPLYEKICEATGLYNLLAPAKNVEQALGASAREVRTEFVTSARAPVAMRPNMQLTNLRPGKTYTVIYTLQNLSNRPVVAQALPSYSPQRAGRWFKKVQCFCFEQLRLVAGEVVQAPVVFVIDKNLPDDIKTISLSYDFFEVEGA